MSTAAIRELGPGREHLPQTWREASAGWGVADWIALAAVPLIFAVGFGTSAIFGIGRVAIIADTAVRILLCAVLLFFYRHLLREHWRRFREHLWRNIGLVVVGAIVMQLVISLVRLPLPDTPGSAQQDAPALIDPVTAQGADLALLFVAALGPLAIVMVEEAVFRHTLLVKLPLWGSTAAACAGIVLNGALFGAIHYYNFGSLVGTIPFMAAGVLFNLVYLWTRNLWHVILMHLLNNFVLTFGALLLLILLRGAIG
jgi:membrane protease YdiL (CAAX protease family)